MKQLVILLLLHLFVSMVIAQPGPLDWKVLQFHGDSGAQNTYTFFHYFAIYDSIQYGTNVYSNIRPHTQKSTLDANQIISIRTVAAQPKKSLGAFHFLNEQKEDVYVYLFLKRGEHMSFEFSKDDTIYIKSLSNLEKGTYLIDWCSRYKQPFHNKIKKRITKEKRQLRKDLKEAKLKEIPNENIYKKINIKEMVIWKDTITSMYSVTNVKIEQIAQLEMDFLERDKKFCGYYRTSVTDLHMKQQNLGRFSTSGKRYAVKLTIPESTVRKQKVSSRPIPPEELTALVNNSKKRTEEQQAILRLIER